MKYEKCLRCDQLGITCDGPNLLLLEDIELGQWLNELRKIRNLTYDKSAAETSVSKTALYNFLTGTHPNCRLDTVRPLAKRFIGGDCDSPCGNVTTAEKASYEERIHQLEAVIAQKDDKISDLTQQKEAMQTLITNTNKRHEEQLQFLRKEIKRKNKFMTAMTILSVLALLYIIVTLIIDMADPSKGYYWLESLFKPHGINEILQKWRT